MTCCLLHNLLRVRSKDIYTPQGFADEISEDGNVRNRAWRNENLAPYSTQTSLLVHLDTLLLNLKKSELCLRTISWDEDKYHGNGSI